MSPRKSNTDMIAQLKAKLAEAEAKEAEKAKTRVAYLIGAIASIDERITKAEDRYRQAVTVAEEARDKAIAKLEERRADLDAELAELASDDVPFNQLTFVEADDDTVDES